MRKITRIAVVISVFVLTAGTVALASGNTEPEKTSANIIVSAKTTEKATEKITGKTTATKTAEKKTEVKAPAKIKKDYVSGGPAITWEKREASDEVEIWYSAEKDGDYVLKATTSKSYYKTYKFEKGSLLYIKLRTKRTVGGQTYYSRFSNYMTLVTSVKLKAICSPGAGVVQFVWNKNNTANGYDVQYSLSPDFSDAVTVSNVKNSKLRYKFYDLKRGVNCYVRIRSIYRFKDGGVNHGLWTGAKKVKVTSISEIANKDMKKTNGFFKNSVFFGDSVLQGFGNYVNYQGGGYLDGTKVYGVVSYSLISALKPESNLHPMYQGKRMAPQYVTKALGAKKVFLFFGVNDIWNTMNPNYCLENYKAFISNIKKVNPKVKIYVISCTYPMKGSNRCVEFSSNMHTYNKLLREYCGSHSCEYIEINPCITTWDGYLKSEYCSDNFVHQTMGSYTLWDKQLRFYANAQSKLK